MRVILSLIVFGFVIFCGLFVVDSGLFNGPSMPNCAFEVNPGIDSSSSFLQEQVCRCGNGTEATEQPCILLQKTTSNEKSIAANTPEREVAKFEAAESMTFGADNAPAKTTTLGSEDPGSGFKFRIDLSSRGASISKVTFSEYNDRDYKDPKPLVLLSPVPYAGRKEILSMANREFVLIEHQQQLALNELSWKCLDIETTEDNTQVARFEAVIIDQADEPVLKLTKTFKVTPGNYLLECGLMVENLSESEQQFLLNLSGPVGIGREAFRSDMRNIIGGFLTDDGQIISSRKDMLVGFPMNLFTSSVGLRDSTREYQKALQLQDQAKINEAKQNLQIKRNLPRTQTEAHFLWAASSNKYFSAILRPVPDEGKDYCDWVADNIALFYNPDGDERGNSGDETIGLDLKVKAATLSAVGQPDASKTYNLQLYLGPKDRDLFHKDEFYKRLGFEQTITFLPCCCCPASIIRPLAFGILIAMKWMHGFIGNYGVVIIILVFLMRLVMHPVTKKSQVSMSKMSKLAPRTEEIKKKYANNKAEMNKQLMQLYKEQGASPIMGMLPMMVQMPIWISLWSAVNASIDLRGAAFLPFWITDLSLPDALIRFSTITIPLLGWKIESLNLLPILMGVAFYLQQKLMPSQAAASANPQMAQQQKMMMIMLPVLFPLMLYKLPSGVNLYIMTSTFAGVIEQHVIRKHIKKKEEEESKGLVSATSKTGGKTKKKKPKPFFRF